MERRTFPKASMSTARSRDVRRGLAERDPVQAQLQVAKEDERRGEAEDGLYDDIARGILRAGLRRVVKRAKHAAARVPWQQQGSLVVARARTATRALMADVSVNGVEHVHSAPA